jgi:hypothetical protein
MKPSDWERLDWLSKKLPDGQTFTWLLCNRNFWTTPNDDINEWHSTPRAAIDAALKAERVKPGRRTGKGRK